MADPDVYRDRWSLVNTKWYTHGCVCRLMDKIPEYEIGELISNSKRDCFTQLQANAVRGDMNTTPLGYNLPYNLG